MSFTRRTVIVKYVYIIQSITYPGQTYIGITADPEKRIKEHNEGKSPHSSKFRPWKLITYIAFTDEQKALAFGTFKTPGHIPSIVSPTWP